MSEPKQKASCSHCGGTRHVFELLGVRQCWTCYCTRTVAEVVTEDTRASSDGVPASEDPHPPSRHCKCMECAAYFNGEPCTRGVREDGNG